MSMLQAVCPECHSEVRFEAAPKLGQRTECAACRAALEVVKVRPLELDWAFEEPLQKSSGLEESVA
jgi:lysine biosynthesis protein LysW